VIPLFGYLSVDESTF